MSSFFMSEYSIQNLEQFRDISGFIDLTKAGIQITDESREMAGNTNRIKNWIDFQGTKALIKGEIILDEEKNYGIYAELIVEEIARQLGIDTAHYDLIKIKDENGNNVVGVLSESIINLEEGHMVSLNDIIGEQSMEESDFPDTTSLSFTIDRLKMILKRDGYSEENINKVITDYKKRLLFTLAVLDTDKHTENVSFIKKKIDGKDVIELGANYDSETALLLDNEISTIEKLLDNYLALKDAADDVHPKIGTLRSIEDGGYNLYWKDTFEDLCEDDIIYEFFIDTINNGLDIDMVLANVEKRINAPLPENVKLMSKYSYELRIKEMAKIMMLEMEEETEQLNVNSFLNSMISFGTEKAKISTGEQIYIGKSMEKSMDKTEELTLEDMLNMFFDK